MPRVTLVTPFAVREILASKRPVSIVARRASRGTSVSTMLQWTGRRDLSPLRSSGEHAVARRTFEPFRRVFAVIKIRRVGRS